MTLFSINISISVPQHHIKIVQKHGNLLRPPFVASSQDEKPPNFSNFNDKKKSVYLQNYVGFANSAFFIALLTVKGKKK